MKSLSSLTALASSIVLALTSATVTAATLQQKEQSSKFAPEDMTQRSFSNVDLLVLISGNAAASEGVSKDTTDEDYAKKLEAALRAFPKSGDDAKLLRNRIQDRLILSSNDLCEDYKSNLKAKQSRFNFFSGIGATLLGVAGSLTAHAATANVFSALAGAATGVRAQYNHDYYADVTAHLITKAITFARSDVLRDIDKHRKLPAAEYTLERALAEAVQYHGACSLITGLEKASEAVTTMDIVTGEKAAAVGVREAVKGMTASKPAATTTSTTIDGETPEPTKKAASK